MTPFISPVSPLTLARVLKASSGVSRSDGSLVGKSHSFIDYDLGITSIIGMFL